MQTPVLPNEIVDQILQHVHRNSRTTLIACMRCNSNYLTNGFKILYRHVALRISDAPRFAQAVRFYVQKSDRYLLPVPSVVRTMRVVVPGDGRDYGYGGTRARDGRRGSDTIAERGIKALCDVLPLLTNLQTFSIVSYNGHRLNTFDDSIGPPQYLSDQTTSARRKPGPTVNMLARLLEVLPVSVRDLSVDLSELSRYDAVLRCDLCPAIQRLLPSLEHLNLHLRSYCRELLSHEDQALEHKPHYHKLQSVVMRIHGFNARTCTRQPIPGPHGFHQMAPPTLDTLYFLDIDKYTSAVLDLISEKRAPNLEQFIIISKRRPHMIRQHSDAKWTVYVRELVSRQTAAIPRVFIDARTPTPGNSFIQSARTTIRLPTSCNFIDPQFWGKDYIGKSGSIRRFVEGLAGWVLFGHGPHIPGLRVKEIQSAVDAGYQNRSPRPSLVDDFRSREQGTCQLWKDEDCAGVRLIDAVVWDGVLDNMIIARQQYTVPTIDPPPQVSNTQQG